jgi:hypothetical protein
LETFSELGDMPNRREPDPSRDHQGATPPGAPAEVLRLAAQEREAAFFETNVRRVLAMACKVLNQIIAIGS